MFEGLIEFIEETVFTLVNQIIEREARAEAFAPAAGLRQVSRIVTMLLQFGEKNPGMTRVMVGDALVFENERLQQRMNQFFDKIEANLKQCLRPVTEASGSPTPSVDAQVRAAVLTAFVAGRLQRFARSGFKRMPCEHLDLCLQQLL